MFYRDNDADGDEIGGEVSQGASAEDKNNKEKPAVQDEGSVQVPLVEPQDDIRRPKIPVDPRRPTQREIDEHEVTHCNYRSWCPHCVRARAVSSPHLCREHRPEGLKVTGVVTVSLDYSWTDGDNETVGNMESPVLIMYVDIIDAMFAIAVKKKGAVPWVATWVAKKLATLGYGGLKVTLKSDGEPAMRALVEAVAIARKAESAIIQSPKRESKCNGAVEGAVRIWRGQLITMKCNLEAEAGITLAPNAAIVEWMVVWAAEVRNYFRVQDCGRTVYELATGHRFPATVAIFGERVMYYTAPPKHGRNKWHENWREGLFLGVQGRTAELIIGVKGNISRTRSMRRLPRDKRWSADMIKELNVGVAQYLTGEAQEPSQAIVVRPDVPVPDPPVPRGFQARRLKLDKQDFLTHGYTAGCPGCLYYRSGIGARAGHTEECRTRMEACLAETAVGAARITAARERVQQHAEREAREQAEVEKNEEAEPQQPREGNAVEPELPEPSMPEGNDHPDGLMSEESRVHQAMDQDEEVDVGECPPPPMLEAAPARSTDLRVEIPRASASKRESSPDVERPHKYQAIEAISVCSIGERENKTDVAEMFSPERVGLKANAYKLVQGSAFDIQNGWDLTRKDHQAKMERILDKEKPTLLIGSPPCTRFSILMNILMNSDITPERRRQFHEELDEAIDHIRFCVKMYWKQLKAGRYFLHEHPAQASSWELRELQEVIAQVGVFDVTSHMCAFGMTSIDPDDRERRLPVMKPTRFLTNSWCLRGELDRRCQCTVKHGNLLCGRAAAAAIYPGKLCEAICRGLAPQLVHDRYDTVATHKLASLEVAGFINSLQPGSMSTVKEQYQGHPGHWRDAFHEEDGCSKTRVPNDHGPQELKTQLMTIYEAETGQYAWDDPNKCELDIGKVHQARTVEMDFFRRREVYIKVPRSQALKSGAKIIKLRWVDTNKGDFENPDYWSRLVGKEFKDGDHPDNFAATPPLEGLRAVISHAATTRTAQRYKVMINDVARAYFNAVIDRELYIELPEEDRVEGEDMVGLLKLCLYGIQDAAKCWQEMVAEHLVSIGFVRGIGHPCVFAHPERSIRTVVHGDDYASAGPPEELKWLQKELEAKFEIRRSHTLGHEAGDEAEGKVLNRILRATGDGWEIEADPRHAELLIQQLAMDGTKGVTSPGTDADADQEDGDEVDAESATRFRGLAARANYLAQDRPDLAFAAKEVCRDMAKPTESSWKRLKRIVRYLVRRPRLIMRYDFQEEVDAISVYADANWAGCKKSRKSTSGGCVLLGSHMLRFWSKTQATIAQSSAESELLGAVRGGVEALGIINLLADFGVAVRASLVLDASAALGILQRRGVGKLRHLDVGALWLQEKAFQKKVTLQKIHGEKNPADLGTKHLAEEVIFRHLHAMNCELSAGRAQTASRLLYSVSRTRGVQLPRRWSPRKDKSAWTRLEGGAFRKLFKSARAALHRHTRTGMERRHLLRAQGRELR